MDNSFIQYFWLFLAFLPLIISFIIAFKNYWQKSAMTVTITLAIGMAIFFLVISIPLFWIMPMDLLSFLCFISLGLIFIMVYVLVEWIKGQLFGDIFNKQKYSELFSFEKKHKKRRFEIIKEKQDNKPGEGL